MNPENLAPFRPERTHAHPVCAVGVPASSSNKFRVRWASCEQDVRQAQRLRYLVFAEEMGACLSPPEGT